MKRELIILIVIVLVAGLLRFWRLGEIPVGFHRDEAFLGYNAYSILKTGRDISSHFLPLHLESFLYSPAGYSYSAIPFIFLFGLGEMAVRFPSAFFGTLTILPLFYIIRFLFLKRRDATAIARVSVLVFALSPWHINLSRVATDHIVALFFDVSGIALFLFALSPFRWKILTLSLFSFLISIFTYQASRSFLPVFLPFLFMYSYTLLPKSKRAVPVFGYLACIILPVLMVIMSPALSTRIRTLSLSASPEAQLVIDEGNREDGISGISAFISRAFHNKFRAYGTQVVQNYFSHFTYDFFFTDRGFPDRYRIPGSGLLYLVELPFLFLGLFFVLKESKRTLLFLGAWVTVGMLGSALTFDDIPNLQRTVVAYPAIAIITGIGIVGSLQTVWRWKKMFMLMVCIMSIGYLYSVLLYLHQYYVHQLVHRPWYRQEGYKELVATIHKLRSHYTRILITDREAAPLIYVLFYTPYDPAFFQNKNRGVSLVSTSNIPFDGLTFVGEECPALSAEERRGGRKGTLYVNGQICAFPDEEKLRILSTIRRRDGTPVFQLTDGLPVEPSN